MTQPASFIDWQLRSAPINPVVLHQPASELNPTERVMIAVLAMFGETAFPGRDRLAALMGCSIACVTRTSESLQEKGWITVTRRKKSDGSVTSNQYVVSVPERAQKLFDKAMAQIAPLPPPNGAKRAIANGANCATILQDKNKIKKEKEEDKEAEAAATPPAPPAPTASGSEKPFNAAAREMLVEVEARIRKATGAENAVLWGRDIKILSRMTKERGMSVIRARLFEDLAWRLERKIPWDGLGFAKRLPGLMQMAGNRQREDEHANRKRAEQGLQPLPPRPAGGGGARPAAVHPLAVQIEQEKAWHDAHPGRHPKSRQEIEEWSKAKVGKP